MANILVPEAHTRAGLGVIRSLGGAGHRVHACSAQNSALGFASTFCDARVVQPSYGSGDYLPWLRRYLREQAIEMVVPSSNFLLAIEACYDEFSPLLPLAADSARVLGCLDKTYVAEHFTTCAEAGQFVSTQPAHAIVRRSDSAPCLTPVQNEYGYYLKGCDQRGAGSERSDKGALCHVRRAESVPDAAARLLQDYEAVLIQAGCTGRQVCVGILRWRGKVRLISTVEDWYEEPHSNGTMSRRRTVRHAAIESDARQRLDSLAWEGVAMLEYRLDEATGCFCLIEINFRYWQYLNLDLRAGADFPAVQAACFFGETGVAAVGDEGRSRLGVISRDTWPGEVACLVNRLRRPSASAYQKACMLLDMMTFGLRPTVHNDLLVAADPKPYFHNLWRFLCAEARAVANKLTGTAGRNQRAPGA